VGSFGAPGPGCNFALSFVVTPELKIDSASSSCIGFVGRRISPSATVSFREPPMLPTYEVCVLLGETPHPFFFLWLAAPP